jgi:predicted anti-sigma-YlaC factor YlaD
MKNICQLTKEKWEAYKEGSSLSSQEIKEIVDHLQTCSSCRECAYQQSLPSLLKESYKGNPPEPSEYFLTNLEGKLKEVEHQSKQITFTEIFLQKGWKLVPIMTALLIFLAGSIAYQYNTISIMRTTLPTIEDVILFEDIPLNGHYVLSAITTEELNNGK